MPFCPEEFRQSSLFFSKNFLEPKLVSWHNLYYKQSSKGGLSCVQIVVTPVGIIVIPAILAIVTTVINVIVTTKTAAAAVNLVVAAADAEIVETIPGRFGLPMVAAALATAAISAETAAASGVSGRHIKGIKTELCHMQQL